MMHLPVIVRDQIQQKFLLLCSHLSRLLRRQASRLQTPEIAFLESLGHSGMIQFAMWKPALLCEGICSTFPFYPEKGQHKIHDKQEAPSFKHPTVIALIDAASKITEITQQNYTFTCKGNRLAAHNMTFINVCSIIPNILLLHSLKSSIAVLLFFHCLHPTS